MPSSALKCQRVHVASHWGSDKYIDQPFSSKTDIVGASLFLGGSGEIKKARSPPAQLIMANAFRCLYADDN
ncbi:hypothetical protein N7516_005949 [Penicillium verrucosum]|uniref:uncharacterized protein n=1 Tax=Penicillium verrucosum TaxID=60171 RepID=UPI0025459918|nr:uncharacterized protein N7516_005949 [Penicillium verrucosum]KAJ5931460.1 hypothetical protein N7516_005949 [Penicillium verrucosum]